METAPRPAQLEHRQDIPALINLLQQAVLTREAQAAARSSLFEHYSRLYFEISRLARKLDSPEPREEFAVRFRGDLQILDPDDFEASFPPELSSALVGENSRRERVGAIILRHPWWVKISCALVGRQPTMYDFVDLLKAGSIALDFGFFGHVTKVSGQPIQAKIEDYPPAIARVLERKFFVVQQESTGPSAVPAVDIDSS